MNPLMNMMGGMAQMGRDSGINGMFGQIRRFAALVGNRNPEQMVRTLMQQRGISENALQEAMQEARSIAREMGLR